MYKYIQKKKLCYWYSYSIYTSIWWAIFNHSCVVNRWDLFFIYVGFGCGSCIALQERRKTDTKVGNENKLNQRKPAQGREKEISLTMAKVLQLISSKGGTNFLHQ